MVTNKKRCYNFTASGTAIIMEKPIALIIEDDVNVSEFFQFTLNAAGYEAYTAFDGKSAFEKLAKYQPHLIMVDMHLPDTNGKEILKKIRKDDKLSNVYVILATGEQKSVDTETETLANFILTKPVEYSQLLMLAQRIQRK